jgi:hypothetical protein
MVNLEHGFIAPAPKEFITSAPAEASIAIQANAPLSEKEVLYMHNMFLQFITLLM